MLGNSLERRTSFEIFVGTVWNARSIAMLEFLDEFIEICGLSLIEMALGQVTKRVQFPSSPPKPLTDKAQQQGSKKHIPVVFNEAGLLVVNKPADLVINSNDKDRVRADHALRQSSTF